MLRSLLVLGTVAALSPALAKDLRKVWRAKPSKSAGVKALEISGDTLLAVSWHGHLEGLDTKTGKTRWRHAYKGDSPIDGPWLAVSGERLAVAREDKPELVGRDVKTGKTVWTRKLGGSPTGLTACKGHRVLVATHRDIGPDGAPGLFVHGIDPDSGKTLWRTKAQGSAVGAGVNRAVLAVRSDFGRHNAKLEAVNCADGKLSPIDSADRPMVALQSISGDSIVATHYKGTGTNQRVCAHVPGEAPRCVDQAQLSPNGVSGATLNGDVLYVVTRRQVARNLDPRPDGDIVAFNLKTQEVVGHSKHSLGGGSPVLAGAQLLSGFGSTGADDFVYQLDPTQLTVLGEAKLPKAPTLMAADAERAYFGSYDGSVYAFKLLGAGPSPLPEPVAVTPVPQAAVAAPVEKWSARAPFAAHAVRAKSSGSMQEGSISGVAFLDAAGERIVVGGSEDRVRVVSVETGKTLWKSKTLGKNVEKIRSCQGGIFASQTYGGRTDVWVPKGEKGQYRSQRTIKAGHGWAFGLVDNCELVVATNFSDKLVAYDTKTGKARHTLPLAKRGFDRRGMAVRGQRVAIDSGDGIKVANLTAKDLSLSAAIAVDRKLGDQALVHVWPLSDSKLLLEYCGVSRCTVQLGVDGPVVHFDTAGAVWSHTVPSTLALSPDGKWLFFFRRGLQGQLVEIATGVRQIIPENTDWLVGAFAPNGRRFALAHHPNGYEVTIFDLKDTTP